MAETKNEIKIKILSTKIFKKETGGSLKAGKKSHDMRRKYQNKQFAKNLLEKMED